MADAALALARRVLAAGTGDGGGALEAATALRAVADTDAAVRKDRRVWAALAYLHSQAGNEAGAIAARAHIENLKTPLPRRLTSSRRGVPRCLARDLDEAEPEPLPQRITDAVARLSTLRARGAELFGDPGATENTAPLLRRSRALRAKGRAIAAAMTAERKLDTYVAHNFALAAALSEDESCGTISDSTSDSSTT